MEIGFVELKNEELFLIDGGKLGWNDWGFYLSGLGGAAIGGCLAGPPGAFVGGVVGGLVYIVLDQF